MLCLLKQSHPLLFELQVLNNAAPVARGGHSMVVMGNKILVCGGTDRNLSECGHVLLFEMQGVKLAGLAFSLATRSYATGLCREEKGL